MGEGDMKDVLRVTDRLRAQCSRREYCSTDVRKKALAALDGDQEKAERVLAALVNEKYVDDLRYASAYARDKSSIVGWGETKIRYMLSMKGISKEIIAEALFEIDDDKASSKLEKLMSGKARSLKDDSQARLKMLRFGLGRGYTYEEVAEVTDRIIGQWKISED